MPRRRHQPRRPHEGRRRASRSSPRRQPHRPRQNRSLSHRRSHRRLRAQLRSRQSPRHRRQLPAALARSSLRSQPAASQHGHHSRQSHAAHPLLLLHGHRLPRLQQARARHGLRRPQRHQSLSRHPRPDRRRPTLAAQVEVLGPHGKRTIPVIDFHRLPGNDPALDTVLKPDELITAVTLPQAKFAKNSWYLKARDRQSYAFALVSVAAGLELDGNTIRSAGLALGGVAHKPWRSHEAEAALANQPATPDTFRKAAEIALRGAHGYKYNAFKIELAKQCIVRALTQATQGVQQA